LLSIEFLKGNCYILFTSDARTKHSSFSTRGSANNESLNTHCYCNLIKFHNCVALVRSSKRYVIHCRPSSGIYALMTYSEVFPLVFFGGHIASNLDGVLDSSVLHNKYSARSELENSSLTYLSILKKSWSSDLSDAANIVGRVKVLYICQMWIMKKNCKQSFVHVFSHLHYNVLGTLGNIWRIIVYSIDYFSKEKSLKTHLKTLKTRVQYIHLYKCVNKWA
jgi:hypothetical protein